MTTLVCTVFLRNRGEVLLLHRSVDVPSYPGRWGGVAGHIEGDPETSARREIREETGLDSGQVSLVRAGNPFSVTDDDLDTRWEIHPFLFDCSTREVTTNWETDGTRWVAPPAIRELDTVPDLWESYERVRPTVDTVADDTIHGSTQLSNRALEVLRDESVLVDTRYEIECVARDLRATRPSMTAVQTRINRVMADAQSPGAIVSRAHEAIDRALRVDSEAAANAKAHVGDSIATLSRSGTVGELLAGTSPTAVLVATSNPGGEGISVAESLATATDVSLSSDTALAGALATADIDTLVVGADTVLADGRVVNKVGTRGAALAAAHEGIEVIVVTASDKIAPGTAWDPAERPRSEVYDGDAPLSVVNPTFDVTPKAVIDAVVTERGLLETEEIEAIAREHRALTEHGTYR